MKDGKPYIWHGSLERSHSFYGILIDRIDYLQKEREQADAEKEAKKRIGKRNLQVLERIKNGEIDLSKIIGGNI